MSSLFYFLLLLQVFLIVTIGSAHGKRTTVHRNTTKTTTTVRPTPHPHLNVTELAGVPSTNVSQNKSDLPSPPLPMDLGRISQQDKEFLMRLCSNGKCLGQSEESKSRRAAIKQLRINLIMKISPYQGNFDLAQKTVETSMRRVFAAKVATIRRFGLPKDLIEPSDDGLWEGDMLVSDNFAISVWKSAVKQIPNVNNEKDFSQTNSLMSSVSNEFIFDEKWTKTIQFQIDDSISKKDADLVRQAFSDISHMTQCTEFVEISGPLTESDLANTIVVQKMNISMPTNICSLSTLRRNPVNNLYLNCGCKNVKGNAIHAILHSMGVGHHHNRVDREKYLTMVWLNVDLQHMDYFVVQDPQIFSTFGTPFDIGSIMNYSPTIASKGLTKPGPGNSVAPTMVVKQDLQTKQTLIGQRVGLSCTDGEIIKKSYCCSKDCKDSVNSCGYWATSDFCPSKFSSFMHSQCPKSCQKCCHFKCSSQCESFCKNSMPK